MLSLRAVGDAARSAGAEKSSSTVPPSNADGPRGEPGAVESNVIRIVGDAIPFPVQSSPEPPKPTRDRSREPQAGTTIGYAVRRLEREATKDPEGLAAVAYERPKAGEIKSARQAALAAGIVENPWRYRIKVDCPDAPAVF